MMSTEDISKGITTNISSYVERTGAKDIEGIVSAVYNMKDYGIETLYTLESDLNISSIKEEYLKGEEEIKDLSGYIGENMKYVSNYDVSVIAAELSKTAVSTIRTVAGTEIKIIKADVISAVSEIVSTPVYSSINANVLKNDMRLKFKARLKSKTK